MSSMPDITEKVIDVLISVKHIPRDGLSLKNSLADLGFDSLDRLNLLFELENKFQISIPDEEARSIQNIGDIVDGVQKLIAKSRSASASPTAVE
jgi:acyl carrier protein